MLHYHHQVLIQVIKRAIGTLISGLAKMNLYK